MVAWGVAVLMLVARGLLAEVADLEARPEEVEEPEAHPAAVPEEEEAWRTKEEWRTEDEVPQEEALTEDEGQTGDEGREDSQEEAADHHMLKAKGGQKLLLLPDSFLYKQNGFPC